jgi:hypothetical protein
MWVPTASTYTNRGKGKIVPVHTTKAYKGTRGIAPLILNLGTRWFVSG